MIETADALAAVGTLQVPATETNTPAGVGVLDPPAAEIATTQAVVDASAVETPTVPASAGSVVAVAAKIADSPADVDILESPATKTTAALVCIVILVPLRRDRRRSDHCGGSGGPSY